MHHIMRLIFFSLFLSLLILSCSIEPVVYEEGTTGDYFAFCTLSPQFKKQKVLIGRMVVESLPRYFPDAQVSLSGAGKASNLIHVKNGIYEELPPYLPIIGDSIYTMLVQFPDGHMIEAKTKIPEDFTLLEPSPGDTLFYQIGSREAPSENLILPVVSWTPSSAAYYYEARTQLTEDRCGADLVRTNYTHTFVPYYPYRCINNHLSSEFFESVRLLVTAIDSSRGFVGQSRDQIVPDSLDWEFGFNWQDEGLINTNKLHFKGGKGFFNAVNQVACDFVLHVKIVDSALGKSNDGT